MFRKIPIADLFTKARGNIIRVALVPLNRWRKNKRGDGFGEGHRAKVEAIMTYRGHVRNGIVVLDQPVTLPEGLEVQVEVPLEKASPLLDESGQTLGQKLLKYAGKAVGLPLDAARNHDHYLYGTPKQ
jgi:hypothetical protein